MKKLILMTAVALISLCFAACTSSNTPEGVTKAYLSAVQKGDYEKDLNLYYSKDTETDDEKEAEILQMFEDKMKSSIEDKQGIASYEVGIAELSEDGNKAVVPYTVRYGNGTDKEASMKTIKADGKWYLDAGK